MQSHRISQMESWAVFSVVVAMSIQTRKENGSCLMALLTRIGSRIWTLCSMTTCDCALWTVRLSRWQSPWIWSSRLMTWVRLHQLRSHDAVWFIWQRIHSVAPRLSLRVGSIISLSDVSLTNWRRSHPISSQTEWRTYSSTFSKR